MPQCRNCQTRLDGAYCPTCGQRDVDLDRPIWSLIGDIVKETFELDGRTALTIKVVYRTRLYFDHLIFSLHLHSAAYVILALMLPLEELANRHTILMILQVVLLAYFLAYFVTAVRRVYQTDWLAAALKSAVVLFGYMILVSVVIENTSNFMIIAD